jgi:hypothetical protein
MSRCAGNRLARSITMHADSDRPAAPAAPLLATPVFLGSTAKYSTRRTKGGPQRATEKDKALRAKRCSPCLRGPQWPSLRPPC